jgi:transposase
MSTAAQSQIPAVSAGIDVSKAKLDIHLLLADKEGVRFTVPNTPEGIRKIGAAFQKYGVTESVPVIIESTGDCHLLLCLLLAREGFAVRLINPLITKKYQHSSIRGGKTDKIDARRLAQIGIMEDEKHLPLFAETAASVSRKKLLSLLKKLQETKQQLSRSAGQWQATAKTLAPFGFPQTEIPEMQQALKAIAAAIRSLEALISDRAAAALPAVTELAKLKGISLTQAAIMLTGLEGKTFANRDQLAAFTGIDVRPRESGKWQGQRKLTKRGNAFLRKTLFQIGWSLKMHNEEYRKYYEKLRARGIHYYGAIIATARKFLRFLFAVLNGRATIG